MSVLPDELWRRVLEIGIEKLNFDFKDLCCVSISCRRLNRLSSEDALWSTLLSSDFPQNQQKLFYSSSPSLANSKLLNSAPKTIYKIWFEKDKERKRLSHQRAILRAESQIGQHARRLQEIQLQLEQECERMNAVVVELSNLQKARQASVALNVWQPEVVRGRQKQLVEQCVVPVESRINALEMDLKLCKHQISVLNRAHTDEKRRLNAAKDQLTSIKYHPLQDYDLSDSRIKRKKLKKLSAHV